MSDARITPSLAAELERLRAAGRADARLSVIVAVTPPETTSTARDVDAVAAAVRTAQEPVLRRLASLGVTDVRRQVLASALEVALTTAQIEAVVSEPSVRTIMLDRAVRVTTDDES